MDVESVKSRVIADVEAHREELNVLSHKIHENPELGFHETKAADWLTAILRKNDFKVERGIYGLPTAFRAVYGLGKPVIALLAEYDALPELGHGCGHNLIATSSIGGGIAARKAVDCYGGSVVVIGTPAEELYGGKVTMAQGGAFSGLDAAMMVHPGNHDSVVTEALALQGVNIEFFGKASHAAAKPEEGINALEAVILSFNAINSLRQHIKSSARIHGIITDGGQAPNIVPAHSAASFMVRAAEEAYLEELKLKVLECFKGAATATGARLEYEWDALSYAPLLNNLTLGKLFLTNLRRFRKKAKLEDPDKGFGSTDFGNVSQLIPGIHCSIAIAPPGVVTHSPQFAAAAGSEKGRQAMMDAAKALALTVADLVAEPELIIRAKNEFYQNKKS